MTFKDFQDQDCALEQQIANYRIDSAEKQAQIAYNEREIIKLQMERVMLRREYTQEPEIL